MIIAQEDFQKFLTMRDGTMIKWMTEDLTGANMDAAVILIDSLQEVIGTMSTLGLITETEKVTIIGLRIATEMWTGIQEIGLIGPDMMEGVEEGMMTVIGILEIEITTKMKRGTTEVLGGTKVISTQKRTLVM